jgi:hypothetical protein
MSAGARMAFASMSCCTERSALDGYVRDDAAVAISIWSKFLQRHGTAGEQCLKRGLGRYCRICPRPGFVGSGIGSTSTAASRTCWPSSQERAAVDPGAVPVPMFQVCNWFRGACRLSMCAGRGNARSEHNWDKVPLPGSAEIPACDISLTEFCARGQRTYNIIPNNLCRY